MVVIIKKLMNVAVLMFIAVPFCSAARATIEQLDKQNCFTGTYLCHFHAECCNRSTQYCSFSSYRCENVSSPYESMEETCCQALHDENLLHREGMVDTCQYNLGNMKSRWTPFCAESGHYKTTTAVNVSKMETKIEPQHKVDCPQTWLKEGIVGFVIGVLVTLLAVSAWRHFRKHQRMKNADTAQKNPPAAEKRPREAERNGDDNAVNVQLENMRSTSADPSDQATAATADEENAASPLLRE